MKRLQSAKRAEITEIRTLAADPYITKQYIADRYKVSVRTVCNWVSELDAYVMTGRYSEYTILDGCGVTYINYLAFVDYLKYRDKLRKKKPVPPFNPEQGHKDYKSYMRFDHAIWSNRTVDRHRSAWHLKDLVWNDASGDHDICHSNLFDR